MDRDDYAEYLKSPHWRETRQIKLEQANNQCEECGFWRNLQVHHLHYNSLGRESLTDLKVLCDRCHAMAHIMKRRCRACGKPICRDMEQAAEFMNLGIKPKYCTECNLERLWE